MDPESCLSKVESAVKDINVSERNVLRKLEEILQQLKERNTNCAISKTVGSAVSICGTVLTLTGILCTPLTAGASLALTAAGAATAVAGITTNTGTVITKNILHKRTIAELEDLLETRLNLYKSFGEQLTTMLDFGIKNGTKITNKIGHFLYINREIFGLAEKKLRFITPESLRLLNPSLKKGVAILGVKISSKLFFIGFGAFFVALDIWNIVDAWTKKPKLYNKVAKLCEEIKVKIESHEKLISD